MEHHVFRDYCKAENSDDEEDNHDLQSRLYAEIYYASNNGENVDTKANVKLETHDIDNNEFRNSMNDNKVFVSNDSFGKNQFSKSQVKTCTTSDVTSDSLLTSEDDKSIVRSTSIGNEPGRSYMDDRNTLHVARKEVSEHSQGNIECSKGKSNPDPHIVHSTSTGVLVKPEIEVDSKEELRSAQGLNFGTTTTHSDCVIPKEYSADNNVERIQDSTCVKVKEDDTYCNVLTKYAFAKLYINDLYLKKYENLNKRLQEIEEEKEASLKNKEHERIHVEEDERSQQGEQSDTHIGSTDETENDTRYNVLTRSEKLKDTSNDSEEVMVLSSDMESDSEESILEVPLPPKPPPPIINVQDSDDSLEISSSDSDMEYPFSTKRKYISTQKNNMTGNYRNKEDTLVTHMTEDIMLNCTEVRKGASSIQEIMETSKNAQDKSEQCSSKDEHVCAKDTSISINEINDRNLNKTNKPLISANDKEKPDVQLPFETIDNSNAVYERDKAKSVSFAEDVNIDNFVTPSLSRKRHHEDNGGPSNAKKKKTADNESRHSPINSKQCENRNKSKEETWDEYFFRPMSDRLKAFYNEPRGQENFDIEEIQSKMSKDPRLWTILDEDLMPSFSKRRRFWNVKCNNCHHEGHQAYNCPQPRKPPQCHMCGTPGHTETRCPQRICLTCGKKQGTFRKTCESCRTLYCQVCNAIGHNSTECPDHWRKFHQTTHISQIHIPDNLAEVMKPADLLYCCNCTKRGHDSSTCHEYRWSQHFPTPAYVTNYTAGLEGENPIDINIQENDMIPLSKNACNKSATTKSATAKSVPVPQGKGDLQGCEVLYTYGHFQSKGNNPECVRRFTEGIPLVQNLKRKISTSILDQLFKVVNFEITVFRNAKEILMIKIRTVQHVAKHLYEFFLYWLQLPDEDKKLHWVTDLPRRLKDILQFLRAEFQDLQQTIDDPIHIHNQIMGLKVVANNKQNPTSSNNSLNELDLRSDLLKVLHTTPRLSKLAMKFQKMIQRLQRTIKKLKSDKLDTDLPLFVDIIILYNKLFLPRTLKSNELNQLLEYCSEKDVKNNKGKENEKSKKQKKKCTPYETFLMNLQNFNRTSANTQRKQKSTNINDDTTHSSKVAQNQDEQLPITSECSLTNNISSLNNSGTKSNVENDHDKSRNEEDTAKNNSVNPVQVVQLQPNQSMPSENVLESNVKAVDKASASSIPPPKKPVCYIVYGTVPKRAQNDRLKSVPCTEVRSEDKIEKQTKITNNSTEIIKPSTSQQEDNVATGNAKKKKPKKPKKSRWSSGPNSQVTVNQPPNVTVLENSAANVINEALTFDLPYMNKAVEEVRKRIIDRNIKQEHIDVLRRLINLEKDHRKYVSAFCSYLK